MYRICIIEPWPCRSSDTTERTMGALPRHVPDAAIAGNSILASVPAPEHAGSRPRRRLNRDLRTVVAVMVATEYFTAALASYLASLIYGWGFVGSTLPETQ